MQDARTFIDSLGRKRVMDRLNASDQAMTNAIKRGLPSRWFAACKELADELDQDCPPELFGMVGFDEDAGGTPDAVSQGGGSK